VDGDAVAPAIRAADVVTTISARITFDLCITNSVHIRADLQSDGTGTPDNGSSDVVRRAAGVLRSSRLNVATMRPSASVIV
jgi:hypothetical protein